MDRVLPDPRIAAYEVGRSGDDDDWVDHILVGVGNSPSREVNAWCGVEGFMRQVAVSDLSLSNSRFCEACRLAVEEEKRKVNERLGEDLPRLNASAFRLVIEEFVSKLVQQGQVHHVEAGLALFDGSTVEVKVVVQSQAFGKCGHCEGSGQRPLVTSWSCTVCGEDVDQGESYTRILEHFVRHVEGAPVCLRLQ